MRVSEALAKAKPLVVEFESGALHVEYRPSSYTVEELEKLVEEDGQGGRRGNPARIIEMIQQMLVSWDLEEDTGGVIDFKDTARMRRLPSSIFAAILTAVRKDQSAGEASSPSAAG